MKRERFQAGFIERQTRKRGPDVWVFRYRDAAGAERKKILGDLKSLPTLTAARKEADKERADLIEKRQVTLFGTLIDRYKLEAVPERHSTSGPYLSNLKRIEERWGKVRVQDIKVMDVERWLASLQTAPRSKGIAPKPLAKHTLSNIKALFHRVWQCGIRWGVLPAENRIALVELRHMRRPHAKQKTVLTPGQFLAIAEDADLPEAVRVMVNIAGRLGLRGSEVLGLRWEDVDLEAGSIKIQRSVVRNRIEPTKTPESEARLPLTVALIALITEWRKKPDIKGWLFGSVKTKKYPLDRENILARHIRPIAKKYGVLEIGWHSFRHTLRSVARDADVTAEDQRQLMRHTDMRMTEHYGRDSNQRLRRLLAAAEHVSRVYDLAEKVCPVRDQSNTLIATVPATLLEVTSTDSS